MSTSRNELNSFEKIFREISLFAFSLKWKGTSHSWEIVKKQKLAATHQKLLKESITSLNAVDRDKGYLSLIFSSLSLHCNYFIVDLHRFEEYVCVGIVTSYDTGTRPSSMECMLYLRSDLLTIKNCIKSILGDMPNSVSDPDVPLTRRERDILELISKGKSQKEIAATLGISNSTVESHKSRLFAKFQVRSSAELISKAYLSQRN